MRRFIPLAAKAALAALPVALLNATAGRAGFVVRHNVAYGKGPRRALDVYAPAVARGAAPVVVFFYGGSWQGGERRLYRFVGASLARRGVVVAIPDYRVFPDVRFPGFMQDAAAAVGWARAHAAAHGGVADRLFLMGHSAGAQIAALLALDARYLRAEGVAEASIAGMIGLAGPYDFLPLHSATLRSIFGPEPERWRSQPINFVGPAAPPMFLAAGTADTIVDPGNTRRLAARLRRDGLEVEERLYRGIGHRLAIGALSPLLAAAAPVRRDLLAFIARRGATREGDGLPVLADAAE